MSLQCCSLPCCFLRSVTCMGSARTLHHTTKQTTAIGTYAWMAPEVKQFKCIATARSALDWRENWGHLWKLLQAFVQLPFSCYIHTVPDSFPCACNKVILLLTHQLSTMISYVDAKEGACLSIMWCVFLWDTALGNHNTWSTIQWCVLCIAAREGVGRKG